MPVPSSMADLSTTAASNYPTGSDSPTSGDDYFRSIQAIIRSTNAKGADIASATTTDIGAATGEFVDVTGTTTITGLGTIAAGIVRTVRFTGALTLTHNATSLILPSSANITTENGDVAQFRSLGSGNWKCTNYIPQVGYPLKSGATFTGALNEAQGANIASAGTVNLTTATGNYVHITGTTTITAITLAQGATRTVVFDGALTLTNGASLLLPDAANITTATGDVAIFRGEAAGVVRCVSYIYKTRPYALKGVNSDITQLTGLTGETTIKGVALLGYGTGAGGTVTQLTSKTTSVTLNKPTGKIIMNNAALAAGASALFALNNSIFSDTDSIIVQLDNSIASPNNYSVKAYSAASGIIGIILTNNTGGSLSDAVGIRFSIIKGASS